MKDLYFLPHWYIQNRENKKNRIIKLIVLIFFIFNIILFNMYSIDKNKLNIIENDLKEHAPIQEVKYSKDNTLKSFMDFYDYIYKETNFKNVNIENRNVEMDIEGKEEECVSLIKNIQNSNKFIIKNFSYLGNENEQNRLWKINLILK